jgi:hypothetical protein
MTEITHDFLCLQAEKWLSKQGFGVVFHDKFKANTSTGEQPDCLGFRSGLSLLLECKTSRSDFIADRKKKFRADSSLGMGDWRFMLAPKGLIDFREIPIGWGLLEHDGRRILKTFGWPTNMYWYDSKPFTGNKQAECDYMYSALRRMQIRGHLKEIYDGMPIKEIIK